MKINSEELYKVLDMQKQVEEYKNCLIKEIDFYELPFIWYVRTVSTNLTKEGIHIFYEMEDCDDTISDELIPWEYFNNKKKYIQKLEKEWELKCKKDAKIAVDERLKLAQQELEQATKLAKAYQETFGDVE